MRFLVDNQLPPALARFLNEAGSEAAHVLDAGLAQAKDAQIWEFALAHSLTLVTKDEDFLQFSLRDNPRGCLIWVRTGNCRTAVLIERFGRIWTTTLKLLEAGERLIEIR